VSLCHFLEGLLNEPFLALPHRHTEQTAKPLRSGWLDTPRPQVIVCGKLKGFGFRVEGANPLAQPSDQNGFVPGAKWAEAEVLANWARWWRCVRSLHSPSKYASAGTPPRRRTVQSIGGCLSAFLDCDSEFIFSERLVNSCP
jgi:hypothetical protein